MMNKKDINIIVIIFLVVACLVGVWLYINNKTTDSNTFTDNQIIDIVKDENDKKEATVVEVKELSKEEKLALVKEKSVEMNNQVLDYKKFEAFEKELDKKYPQLDIVSSSSKKWTIDSSMEKEFMKQAFEQNNGQTKTTQESLYTDVVDVDDYIEKVETVTFEKISDQRMISSHMKQYIDTVGKYNTKKAEDLEKYMEGYSNNYEEYSSEMLWLQHVLFDKYLEWIDTVYFDTEYDRITKKFETKIENLRGELLK